VVRGGLLALEASVGLARPDPRVTEELFRTFHSIKGLAGMVEHRETELLAHEMETYLRAVREAEVRLTTAGLETLIDGAQLLEQTIAARRENRPPVDIGGMLEKLRDAAVGAEAIQPLGASSASASGSWQCIFTPSPRKQSPACGCSRASKFSRAATVSCSYNLQTRCCCCRAIALSSDCSTRSFIVYHLSGSQVNGIVRCRPPALLCSVASAPDQVWICRR